MTKDAWDVFFAFRESFKAQIVVWQKFAEKLLPLQIESSQKDTPPYPVENPVVYNTALDEITQNDDIKIILIGDNPGKEEQREKNKRYLVGQSGKIADGFFKKNPGLKTDFRKNVIILNKTPVHTAKTKHLRSLILHGDSSIHSLLCESQRWMAFQTANLHRALASFGTQLWLVGYSELKEKGIFTEYKNALLQAYTAQNARGSLSAVDDSRAAKMLPEWNSVLVFQHFSMNCFLIDLKRYQETMPNQPLPKALGALGAFHRTQIFGTT